MTSSKTYYPMYVFGIKSPLHPRQPVLAVFDEKYWSLRRDPRGTRDEIYIILEGSQTAAPINMAKSWKLGNFKMWKTVYHQDN